MRQARAAKPGRRTGLSPQLLRGEAAAFGEAAQFGPGEVGMDPAAEAAIGAGDDVLAADDLGIAQDAVGDELRVLDQVGGVADHTRHQHLARRPFSLLATPATRALAAHWQPRTNKSAPSRRGSDR